MNRYTAQAEQFLNDCGAILDIEYKYTGPHFEDEEKKRDVYQFTIKTPRGMYSATFGDSVYNTERRVWAADMTGKVPLPKELSKMRDHAAELLKKRAKWRNHKPTAYDILACLTKYDPGTFQNFCSDFGYDTDSRKAERTYFAVQQEWAGISRIFTPEQLEALADII